MTDLTKLNYALYARKSTESEDRQVQSIDDQLSEMHNVANKLGLNIVKGAIITESKSAKIPYKRDGFNKLIELINSGVVDGVLSWKSNRLSRNPTESGIVQQLLIDDVLKAIVTPQKTYLPEENALILVLTPAWIRSLFATLRRLFAEVCTRRQKKDGYRGSLRWVIETITTCIQVKK